MRTRQDVQIRLRNRYRALYTASGQRIGHEIDLIVDWISSQPLLKYILQDARLAETTPSYEEWLPSVQSFGWWDWPTKTESGRAVFIWDLLRHISASDQEMRQFLHVFSYEKTYDGKARDFAEQVVQPLIDYLGAQVGEGSSVLYALGRYVRQVEWFDQDYLYERFRVKSRQGEEVYDRHLREFLFREGFNMPYSQQHSASGIPDILSGLEGDDALICEMKLFDGQNRDIAHIASGVTQARQYAMDHRQPAGHLVIINLTARPLQLPGDGPADVQPGYLDLPDARVYLMQVRGLPRESASKQGKTQPLAVQRTQLVGG